MTSKATAEELLPVEESNLNDLVKQYEKLNNKVDIALERINKKPKKTKNKLK